MKKQKQVHKTREELIADLKGNKEFQEKMKFTREVFYPALCKASTSIDDATQHLSIINSVVMEKFLSLMKEKKMSDLKIVENLSAVDPKYQDMKEMLELFDDFSVFDAKAIMEGMKSEITLFVTEENKSRKLSELKTVWIDQL